MIDCYCNIKQKHKDFFVGINLLGVDPFMAMNIAFSYEFDALWTDESFIRGNTQTKEDIVQLKNNLEQLDLARMHYFGKYFGSVAFKTQPFCPDPENAAINAIGHMDYITTSGPSTASPPEIEKIIKMKKAIGDNKLAIASGVTPENIKDFKSADAILVSSGISDSWTEINENKLKELIKNANL